MQTNAPRAAQLCSSSRADARLGPVGADALPPGKPQLVQAAPQPWHCPSSISPPAESWSHACGHHRGRGDWPLDRPVHPRAVPQPGALPGDRGLRRPLHALHHQRRGSRLVAALPERSQQPAGDVSKEEEEEAGAMSPPACPSVYEGLSCMGTAPWGWQSHHSPVFVTGSGIKRHSITSSGTWAHRQQRKWDFS